MQPRRTESVARTAQRATLLALVAGAAFSATPAVAAGDDSICAARPGKATPACTVAAGRLQVETGLADWSLQKGDGDRTTSLAVGETAFRVGLTDSSEVEIDVTPWEYETDHHDGIRSHASGVGDLNVAYKRRLTSDQAAVQVALMPVLTIPTARHDLGSGKLQAALLVPASITLGKSPFSLGLTPELDWSTDADGHGHHAAMVQVASLGWQATQKLTLSAELWGQWDRDHGQTTRQASADGALAYLLNKDVQIDGGANIGLNKATPDVELYAGIARRF